jgi:hypothetical protein
MSTWNEQLKEIEQLRKIRKLSDKELYNSAIALKKASNVLDKVKQKETNLTVDQEEINDVKKKIAGQDKAISTLNNELISSGQPFTELEQVNNLIEFLQKKISTTNSNLQEVTGKLEVERNQQKPDRAKIDEWSVQLGKLKGLLNDLEENLAEAKNRKQLLEQQVDAINTRNREIKTSLARHIGEKQQIEERLAGLLESGQTNQHESEERQRNAEGEYKRNKEKLSNARGNLQQLINAIYIDPHPKTAIKNLADDIPFLLLPVRIETRFVKTERVNELLLRVYPDDISIHTHEAVLTDKEVAEGEKYWKALFQAEKGNAAEKEDRKKSAWSFMATTFGGQRSAWIARETKPLNWITLATLENEDKLVFPAYDLTKTADWSRAPRTEILPDKFVVILYEGDQIVKEIVGSIIPDELFVGPDPMDAEAAFEKKDNSLVFGEEYNWMSDFDKAVASGMGFRIPLTPQQAENGFSKVLVLGVMLSAEETASQQSFESLINNHHYSPKGFSLVRQGTPTNNTELDGSGYTKNDAFNETSYFIETGNPKFSFPDECDGRNLADALGIEYAPLQYVLNSNAQDHKEAVAMNTALYPSTLGYFFGSMMYPVLKEPAQEMLRDFTVNHVTGRGWLPAIRVGNQPYGVLLTSDSTQWEWPDDRRLLQGNKFYETLWKVLEIYHSTWKALLNDLKYVGKPGTDPSDVLLNILGLQPGSASFYQRVAYSTDDLKNRDDFEYGGRYYADMQKGFTSKNELLVFLEKLGYDTTGPNGLLKIPQQLRLVFQHYHTLLDAANLIDNVPLSEKDKITNYDKVLGKNYLHWLSEAKSVEMLEEQDFGEGKKPPASLLYMQLRRSLLLQLKKASILWFGKNNIDLQDSLRSINFHNIRSSGTLSAYEIMKAKVGVAAPNHNYRTKPVADYLLTIGINEDAAEFLGEMKSALGFLAKLPTARLERCFTEHMDTCTYRLDAWQSAIFKTRLLKQRKLNNIEAETDRKKGIYIGAYGWVENLRPSAKRLVVKQETVPEKLRPAGGEQLYEYSKNGGFVHAPSLNHASAAALLRAGYMSHATVAKPDTMAVNISSDRVRRGLFILQGIRNGQSLEALLGYQFERGLHDRASNDSSLAKLNLYIYDYRDAYPISSHLVNQEGTNAAEESIPANNVTNGLLLAESSLAFPFGASGDVASASIGERDAIISEKNKLSETLDAVKDLLLSESVYQLVQGNFDRSGAVVNALKESNIPPELDVVNTPGSVHFSYTNRVMVQFDVLDPGDPSYNPWDPIAMSPRAKMEPGINKWLASIIDVAGNLICRVSHKDKDGNELGFEEVTVDKLKIQPIDLVYITGNELNTGSTPEKNTAASELESRIAFYYRRQKGIDDDVQVSIEFMKPDNPAGKKTIGSMLPLLRMLKSLITDSRSLHAEDFDPPSKKSLADKDNPKAYDTINLETRVQQEAFIFKSLLDSLNTIAISAVVEEEDGTINNCTKLKEAFDALDKTKKNFNEITFSFGNVEADLVQQVLIQISNYGLSDTFPQLASALTNATKLVLLEQARNTSRRMTLAHSQMNQLITDAGTVMSVDAKVEKLVAAGKKILGDVFNILPLFTYNNEADIQQSKADNAQILKHAKNELKMRYPEDEWLQNIAHVRPRLAKWEYIRSLQEIMNSSTLKIEAIQLPYRALDSWVAVEFPAKDSIKPDQPFNINHDTLSIVIHGDAAFSPGKKRAGLLVDDWTELVPAKENMTGISFNYDQPNAVPPQALLLAVTPKEKGHWEWSDLVGIVNDTLNRAKLRAIEPQLLDKVKKPELGVLLPALMADFSQFDLDIALDYKLNLIFFVETTPIMTARTLIK